jgi:predicted nucleic acid-binding protein
VTVVCNTSPITNLAAIAQLDLLYQLYGEILIPQAVYDELTALQNPVPGTVEVQTLSWIRVQRVVNQSQVAEFRRTVDAGEAEALALALEVSAERVLIDDAAGRAIALELGLTITGVLGVLLMAKQRQLIAAVRPLMDALIAQAGFWVSEELYQRVLHQASE